ncbi:hypothetical protein SISNIDRAFT_452170 [Sistotremastrum niveocremeum HHB9708]|uniref:Uncharacterized protein n=1 Tax=Sistotremastrum niveocremeum HHB9708 TaxID=1314777 RepID=A0A164WZT8_9AGAM|nr:hypothetical protein SISNIDRAFT_452170 [Sistotremastrum niveocremeum HHB9708]
MHGDEPSSRSLYGSWATRLGGDGSKQDRSNPNRSAGRSWSNVRRQDERSPGDARSEEAVERLFELGWGN